LALAWNEPQQGIYCRTFSEMQYELTLGEMELKNALSDLEKVATSTIEGNVITITPRRMFARENERQLARARQREYQNNILRTIHKTKLQFDFEPLWLRYPRRESKKLAMAHFVATVQTQENYEAINKAMENYLNYISREGILPQYVKNGATWFNNWKDWVDYNGPQTPRTQGLPKYVDNIPCPEDMVSLEEVSKFATSLGKRSSK